MQLIDDQMTWKTDSLVLEGAIEIPMSWFMTCTLISLSLWAVVGWALWPVV
jgi:hypothetical protein